MINDEEFMYNKGTNKRFKNSTPKLYCSRDYLKFLPGRNSVVSKQFSLLFGEVADWTAIQPSPSLVTSAVALKNRTFILQGVKPPQTLIGEKRLHTQDGAGGREDVSFDFNNAVAASLSVVAEQAQRGTCIWYGTCDNNPEPGKTDMKLNCANNTEALLLDDPLLIYESKLIKYCPDLVAEISELRLQIFFFFSTELLYYD